MESGEALCLEAEKKLKKGGFFSFFSGGPNYDDIGELYIKAANAFKLRKEWQKATDCFVNASKMFEKADDSIRSLSSIMEAGHTSKKYSSSDATKFYNHAIEMYDKSGRFGQSAKTVKNIAELYEAEGDLTNAMNYYKKAADYFDMDEYGKSQYSVCILKYAEATSKLENNYTGAINIFETEAAKALKNPLIQFSAKDYLLKAGILRLVQGDTVDIKLAIERYSELDPRFSTSREGKLFNSLSIALEEKNEDAFVNAIQDYDNITRLDPWRIHFLYKIRENFQNFKTKVALDSLRSDNDAKTSDDIDLT